MDALVEGFLRIVPKLFLAWVIFRCAKWGAQQIGKLRQ